MYIHHVDHTFFALNTDFLIIAMAVLGGIGTLFGPVSGSAVLYSITSLLISQGIISQALVGITIMIGILVAPQGVLVPVINSEEEHEKTI